MKSRILSIILSVVILSQICFAQLCAKLVDVAAGEYHTLALVEDKSLWATGYNGEGQLGLGNTTNYSSLQRVHGLNNVGFLNNVIAFDAGWFQSLAATSDGFCLAWGDDASGQLGNGPNEDSCSVPTLVHGLNNDANGLRNIVKVSAGRTGQHSLCVDSNGYVYGFGLNGSGQCGNGNSQISPIESPILVLDSNSQTTGRYLGDEANIIDVEAGTNHSLALASMTDGGIVFEWGSGVNSTPRKVQGISKIIDIAAFYGSVAADSNGQVWYWTTGGTPTRVPGGQMGTTYLQNIVKVAVGGGNICAAIDVNGQVWQWTTGGSPAKVPDGDMQTQSGELENITAVDVGYGDFRVAVDEYGRGWGWGIANGNGEIGVGDTNPHPEPTEMLCPQMSSSRFI